MTMNAKEISDKINSRKNDTDTSTDTGMSDFQGYLDDYDRTAKGAGSSRGTDRFSALDINEVFEKGYKDFGQSKQDAAQQVLDFADSIKGKSSMGGAAEDALDRLRRIAGQENEEEAAPEPQEPIQQSKELAGAKASVTAYDEEILPNTGDIITGTNTSYNNDFLKNYKLNLAKEMKPIMPDGTDRSSKIQQEKDKVEGQNGFE